jgi:hypothetical protein
MSHSIKPTTGVSVSVHRGTGPWTRRGLYIPSGDLTQSADEISQDAGVEKDDSSDRQLGLESARLETV